MGSRRRRLGVALILDPPLSVEVDGLRRALGDPSLGRIPPHLTLVPPVNVKPGDLPAALERVRAAARTQEGPLRLTLGPVRGFLPDNPVLYLSVGGDLERLRLLRDAVFGPPLERILSWPWVPHVTVADGIEESRVVAGLEALGSYAVAARIDRVVLLEEQAERVWVPLADATFGSRVVVGHGGLALEINQGRLADPEALQLIDDAGMSAPRIGRAGPFDPVIVTGRREGELVGVSVAWADQSGGHLGVLVRSDVRRQGIGSHLLAHTEMALRRAGWPYETLTAMGPNGFFERRSAWTVG